MSKVTENAANAVKLERLFLRIVLIAGLLMIMIEAPMSAPDERVSFFNAYGVSTGQFYPHEEDGVLKKTFPKNYINYADKMTERFSAGRLDERQSFQEWYYDSWLHTVPEEKESITYWNVDANPMGFLISGIGMAVFRILFTILSPGLLTPLNLIMAGKASNLLFYSIVCYQAIRLTPVFKRSLFVLALMPMSLYQAASLNYDAVLISTCFYLFAFVCAIIRDDNCCITAKDIVTVICIAAVLIGVKQAYIFLLLSLFAIPKRYFVSTKKYIYCITAVIITFLAVYILPQVYLKTLPVLPTSESGAMAQQTAYVLHHPIELLQAIINSFIKYRAFYLTGFVGILGQLDMNFPVIFHALFWSALMLCIVCDGMDNMLKTKKIRIYTFIGGVLSIIAAFAGIYIIWTSFMQGIGVDFVDGVQGRYFIPLVPFMLLICYFPKLRHYSIGRWVEEQGNQIAMMCGVSSSALTVMLIMMRFML